ncbi:hypothetical protein FB45DRAFT_682230, partial [Roridomyces roridus]
LLRHYQDPSLQHTLQHRWMNDKKNIKPEIAWSQFRQRFAPGFENVLEIRVHKGWYSPGNLLESLVFRWVFIPWLQAEIDNYVNRVNTTAKRADRNKILPHGVPNDIFQYPDDYGALDFKIMADTNAIEHVRSLYAPRGHDVFKFVPDDFAALAAEFYGDIGNPPVSQTNVWEVYLQILQRFEHPDTFDRMPRDRDAEWGHVLTMAEDDYREEHLELIPNLENLAQGREGYIYYGGVNNGLG